MFSPVNRSHPSNKLFISVREHCGDVTPCTKLMIQKKNTIENILLFKDLRILQHLFKDTVSVGGFNTHCGSNHQLIGVVKTIEIMVTRYDKIVRQGKCYGLKLYLGSKQTILYPTWVKEVDTYLYYFTYKLRHFVVNEAYYICRIRLLRLIIVASSVGTYVPTGRRCYEIWSDVKGKVRQRSFLIYELR